MKPWEGKGCSDTRNAFNYGYCGDHVCTDSLRDSFKMCECANLCNARSSCSRESVRIKLRNKAVDMLASNEKKKNRHFWVKPEKRMGWHTSSTLYPPKTAGCNWVWAAVNGVFTWTWEKQQKSWFMSTLGAQNGRGLSWKKPSLGHYLWRGRGYLLPGTSIMGQVMKDGLQDSKKEKSKITTLPQVAMKLVRNKTVNLQVQPRLCSPGRGTRWPVSFLQVCEVPAVTVG